LTLVYKKQTLDRGEMLEWLDAFTIAPGENVSTFYLPPQLSRTELENNINTLEESPDINAKLIDIITRSSTGTVIFWGRQAKCIIIPPFIISNKLSIDPFSLNSLQKQLSYDYIIALVLIRLGSYAIGVYRGEKRLGSKVGTGLVHGRHRQGGSSAHRFERHRDKQIEYFMTRVCQHAREQIVPYEKSLDYIVYGGARTTIIQLQKQCPLLGRLKTPTLPPLLDIPDPRQAVLEKAISRVWSSTVYTWHED
jgi:peptide subunit release factor 1 (eRF1)